MFFFFFSETKRTSRLSRFRRGRRSQLDEDAFDSFAELVGHDGGLRPSEERNGRVRCAIDRLAIISDSTREVF